LFAGLRLEINETKSAVDLATRRDFLGYGFWVTKDGRIKRRIASKALGRMKDRVREITRRTSGRSLSQVAQELGTYLVGWKEYFKLTEMATTFVELDGWIRHRLRCLQLKQWRRQRTVYRALRKRGASEYAAAPIAKHTRRWWHTS